MRLESGSKVSSLSLLCFIVVASLISPFASGSSSVRGVSPDDENYYKSKEVIKCRDGSKKFTRAQLNDDFCDCPDATDEPGTSACPNGKFYCRNAGHAPLSIFSSRVNDGICDCCDGSDEYEGKASCQNTCWEAGKVARDKLKKKIETFMAGVLLRKQDVEAARLALAKDETELSKLKNDEKILKGLVEQLKERKEQIEKAEEKERLQKEKEEKEKKEIEEVAQQENSKTEDTSEQKEEKNMSEDDTIGLLDDSPSDQGGAEHGVDSAVEVGANDNSENEGSLENHVKVQSATEHYDDSTIEVEQGDDSGNEGSSENQVKQGKDESENTKELSKEELGRLVASRWTGENSAQITENTEQKTGEVDEAKDTDPEETLKDTQEEEDDGFVSETDDDQTYDDVDDTEDQTQNFDDHDDSSSSYMPDPENDIESSDIIFSRKQSWLEKIQQTVRKILQSVNLFQTPVDKSEADHVRKEYDESYAKLSKIQSRISSLTKKLGQDFGLEKEFYSFYGRCFESRQNKYVYKVCPFKQASQVEGHTTTQLGHWEKFEDAYKVMLFSNGDRCWNGPDRNIKVKLRCGLNNEVTDVDEPSRCEYVAKLATPAVCLEERLKELQHKLDSLSKEQPQDHDEL